MALISRRVPLSTFGLPGAASDIVLYVAHPVEATDNMINMKLVVIVLTIFMRRNPVIRFPAPNAELSGPHRRAGWQGSAQVCPAGVGPLERRVSSHW